MVGWGMDTLRDAIEQSGLSRAEVVRRAGVSRAGLFNWLAGRSAPTKTNVAKLAAVLSIEPESLDPQFNKCNAGRHLNPDRDSRGRCVGCLKDAQERYRPKRNERNRRMRRERKVRIFDKYGGSCQCCREEDYFFLSIDHVENDGNVHRREMKTHAGGGDFYIWLDNNPKDERYQLLCFNCNVGKAFNGGVCPHTRHNGGWPGTPINNN